MRNYKESFFGKTIKTLKKACDWKKIPYNTPHQTIMFWWNYSRLVQLVEHRTVNPYVAGSSPASGAKFLESRDVFLAYCKQEVSVLVLG